MASARGPRSNHPRLGPVRLGAFPVSVVRQGSSRAEHADPDFDRFAPDDVGVSGFRLLRFRLRRFRLRRYRLRRFGWRRFGLRGLWRSRLRASRLRASRFRCGGTPADIFELSPRCFPKSPVPVLAGLDELFFPSVSGLLGWLRPDFSMADFLMRDCSIGRFSMGGWSRYRLASAVCPSNQQSPNQDFISPSCHPRCPSGRTPRVGPRWARVVSDFTDLSISGGFL